MSEIFSAIVRHRRADLLVRASASHLLGVDFLPFSSMRARPNDVAIAAAEQLERYLDGAPADFSALRLALPARTSGFARRVYEALLAVPYGARWPYKELAFCARTRAYQALGAALGRNAFLIVLPCHRIVRSDRDLGGFSAFKQAALGAKDPRALAAKETLLALESEVLARSPLAAEELVRPPKIENFEYFL